MNLTLESSLFVENIFFNKYNFNLFVFTLVQIIT